MTKHYDFIFAGGGAAGLSLAYQLSRSALAAKSMLIVDPAVKNRNDHTWCFWTTTPTPVEPVVYRTWERLGFFGEDFEATFDLAPYRYQMVRGIDFYRFMRENLGGLPNVDFLLGSVERIVDGPQQAEILVNEQTFSGDWVFDSRYRSADYRPLTPRYHYLAQHFLGWEIETPDPAFDPQTPWLFDFRTPQRGAMRFMYVLPFSERRALVEYTLFSADLLPQAEYEVALRAYIADVLGVRQYRILEEERDLIPMTDQPFPRRAGQRVMNTGTRGGRVKASSGYAFLRIQQDTAAIARSLQKRGHPFDVPTPPRRYRVFDTMLLQILYRRGDLSKRVFTDLFRNNPVARIFRFLDEEGSVGENLRLMASVPPEPFVRAWIKTQILRTV